MAISIVTPSFRNSNWLKLCIASVADQRGVEVEHIVQDACSDDGTQEWLPKDGRVRVFIEKDQGMYDAINRGFRRAGGDILAYLNCDEQYLPGALKAAQDYFAAHPQVEALGADTVVTDAQGNYICSRYSLRPLRHEIWVRFPILTSAFFVRRGVVEQMGIGFDTQWRGLGDFFWVEAMVRRGVRFGVLPRFTSIFTETGANMCLKPNAVREGQKKRDMTPRWIRRLGPAFVLKYRCRLAWRGAMRRRPFDYWLYTLASTEQRVKRSALQPTSFWSGRSIKLPWR